MPDRASGELVPIMVCDGVLEVVADVVVGPLASRYRGSVGKDSGAINGWRGSRGTHRWGGGVLNQDGGGDANRTRALAQELVGLQPDMPLPETAVCSPTETI